MGMKPSPPQLIRDAELIKSALSGENGTLGAGHKRQELCRILGSLLLTDLDFALDKKAEQDLWNLAFRIPIQTLQNKTKEHKGNSGAQCQLTNLLETATGFYLQLLQNLCWVYHLDLPCNPAEHGLHLVNKAPITESHQAVKQPRQTSVLYICQHCLVHLGDLARYRGQSLQAENFYRHALDISPNNGQPYNQLALLEAASGEKLSSVLYYMRSLAVQFPFPLAATNLHKLFSNILATEGLSGEVKTRHTAYEYIQSFLHVHARLHLRNELETLDKSLSDLALSLPALVIAERLDSWQLLEMVALCLFAWEHAIGVKDHKRCTAAILDLLAGMLNAFLLPLHASLSPRDSTRYFCNPPIKIIFEWLVLHNPPLILKEQFLRRPQIWQGFCKLLNDFNTLLPEKWKNSNNNTIPLPEDWDLHCFLPLANVHSRLKFDSEADLQLSEEDIDHLRASRLLCLGQALAELETRKVITLNPDGCFAAVPCDLTSTDIQEISLTNHHPEGGSNGRLDNEVTMNKEQAQQEVRFQLEEPPPEPPRFPEPTLPTPRNEKSQRSLTISKSGVNRIAGRQNVAMQAILQQRAAASTQLADPLTSNNVPNDHSLKPTSLTVPRLRLPETFFATPPPNFPDPPQNSRLVERYPQCRATSIQMPTGPGNGGEQHPLNSWGQAVPTFQQNTQPQQQPSSLAPTARFIQPQAPHQQMVFGGQATNKLVVQPPKPPPPLYGLCPPQPQTAAPLWNYMVPPPNYFMVDNYSYPQTYRQDHHPTPPPPPAPSAKQTWSLDDNQLRGYGGNSKPSTASLSQTADSNTYSLFSSSPWPSLPPRKDTDLKNPTALNGLTGGTRSLDPSSLVVQQRIQSLWSSPGPSPLERLLEQQKLQHRDNGT